MCGILQTVAFIWCCVTLSRCQDILFDDLMTQDTSQWTFTTGGAANFATFTTGGAAKCPNSKQYCWKLKSAATAHTTSPIVTAGYTDVTLNYELLNAQPRGSDVCTLSYSVPSAGGPWTQIHRYNESSGDDTLFSETYNGWAADVTNNSNGFYLQIEGLSTPECSINDVQITANAIPTTADSTPTKPTTANSNPTTAAPTSATSKPTPVPPTAPTATITQSSVAQYYVVDVYRSVDVTIASNDPSQYANAPSTNHLSNPGGYPYLAYPILQCSRNGNEVFGSQYISYGCSDDLSSGLAYRCLHGSGSTCPCSRDSPTRDIVSVTWSDTEYGGGKCDEVAVGRGDTQTVNYMQIDYYIGFLNNDSTGCPGDMGYKLKATDRFATNVCVPQDDGTYIAAKCDLNGGDISSYSDASCSGVASPLVEYRSQCSFVYKPTDDPTAEFWFRRYKACFVDGANIIMPTPGPTTDYYTREPTTLEPTTADPTTADPTTADPTTADPATADPTTEEAESVVSAERNLETVDAMFQWTLSSFIGLCALFCCVAGLDGFCIRKNDYLQLVYILSFSLQAMDMISDCFFVAQVSFYDQVDDDAELVYTVVFYASIFFIVFPVFTTLGQLYREIQREWAGNADATEWLKRFATGLYASSLLCGGSFAAVRLVNSHVFQVEIFAMGLSRRELRLFNTKRLWSIVLLENFPQLVIQGFFLFFSDTFSAIAISSIVFSSVSMLVTVFGLATHRKLLINEKVTMVTVKVAGNSVMQGCSLKRSLQTELSRLLEVHRESIEIMKPALIANGVRLTFYISENKSVRGVDENAPAVNHGQVVSAAIDTGDFADIVSRAWKFAEAPVISDPKYRVLQNGQSETSVPAQSATLQHQTELGQLAHSAGNTVD